MSVKFKPVVYKVAPLFIWFLLLLLPFLSSGPVNSSPEDHHRFLLHVFINNVLLLVVFYLHTYLVYPIAKRELLWYLVVLAILAAIFGLSDYFINLKIDEAYPVRDYPFGPPRRRPNEVMPFLSFLIALLCSFCYRIIIDNVKREQLLQERETANLRTELSFLRSQINPHFLFNILNSLTSLARKKSDKLEPAIINLSQLMRYMLYESDSNKVSLKKELTYLTSYIDLQLLRFGTDVSVKTNFTGNYEECRIEPMLLIPLVENAFKHGADVSRNNVISIDLDVSADCKTMVFNVQNYFSREIKSTQTDKGIGLSNIRRRLDILYPGKHDFKTSADGDLFAAKLSIDFF